MSADKLAKLRQEYLAHAHGMQTGVALMMERGGKDHQPKHLRVGINAAMADQAGLVKLLIDKGVFTEVEYYEAVRDSMKLERDRYQVDVNNSLGGKVEVELH